MLHKPVIATLITAAHLGLQAIAFRSAQKQVSAIARPGANKKFGMLVLPDIKVYVQPGYKIYAADASGFTAVGVELRVVECAKRIEGNGKWNYPSYFISGVKMLINKRAPAGKNTQRLCAQKMPLYQGFFSGGIL